MYYVYVHSNPLGTYDMTRLQCSSLDQKVRTTKTPDELSAVSAVLRAAVLRAVCEESDVTMPQ